MISTKMMMHLYKMKYKKYYLPKFVNQKDLQMYTDLL